VRVSVNSFGYGGTNCHVILESIGDMAKGRHVDVGIDDGHHKREHASKGTATNEANTNGRAPLANATTEDHVGRPDMSDGENLEPFEALPLLFPLTASSEAALDAVPDRLLHWLSSRILDYSTLRNLSYTMSCRRSLLKLRKSIVASSAQQLLAELQAQRGRRTFRAAPSAQITFVFTGQGAQWAGMGRELLTRSKVFRDSLERSTAYLRRLGCEWDLVEELTKPDDQSRIHESAIAQPATTILQIALVEVFEEYGVRPQWVVGHSSGEIAGAYAAGILDHGDAIRA
jgi:acyl transferase domain-containing protein